MKTLIKKLPLLAFVFAIFGAFAFNLPEKEVTTSVWYELDTKGNVLQQMQSAPDCEFGSTFCAVEIDINQLDDGEPQFTNVTNQGASQHYIRYVEKL